MTNTSTAEITHTTNLPWPFPDDLTAFRYSVNVEPARVLRATAGGSWGAHIVDLTNPDYPQVMAERRRILDADPGRTQILDGMMPACWDILVYYLRDLALSYPLSCHLAENGDRFHWRNNLLGTDQTFVLGDLSTLPYDPLSFLGREIPDDLLLVKERDGQLFFDAGLVTFAAAWSVSFDVGMNFREIHGPVPRFTGEGLTSRAELFLMHLPTDSVYRRVNWTLSASGSRKLDVSLEELPEWGGDMPRLVSDRDFGNVQLRIELEHFMRLPMSGAITFCIRTFMASFAEIKAIPAWRDQLAQVLTELPDDLATYKGFIGHRTEAVAWLLA
ncbi:DUF3445 domain-containing protein [Cryobacterium sp. TMT1-3]|uniref:DUF3445 domain-containing protein n=1 Tax=Cryobacterium luteum TaxID=1424661 RepID=A0A1H8K8T4_9MICO|nr:MULTISPECIES: DUF3445 domain-containing protein [Cryobacterium]TFB92379.1 DUF3445 domain-containing protein [Cryobacterium luteum]TFC25065.1 DUF3445 domain-containing protein [Cryobacterium sp. TMT1-3]SEN89334.1 Protein of unknown function [Cryobacterium luteum]